MFHYTRCLACCLSLLNEQLLFNKLAAELVDLLVVYFSITSAISIFIASFDMIQSKKKKFKKNYIENVSSF